MRLFISIFTIPTSALRLYSSLFWALYRQQTISVFSKTVVGKRMKPIKLRVFKASNKPLANLDLWLHYLSGELDLVGPELLEMQDIKQLNKQQRDRFKVAPGLISPYQIRKHSGIAHSNELTISANFANHATALRRFQVIIAAIFQWLLGNKTTNLRVPDIVSIFGVTVRNVTMNGAIDSVMDVVNSDSSFECPKKFAFINADCVNKYVVDARYKRALDKCDELFADGIGMRLAARWHKARLVDNVNGTDMFPLLCNRLSTEKKKVFLYGGSQTVVDDTATKLALEFPGIELVGQVNGFSNHDHPEAICRKINNSAADILFVAMGAPLQECWIANNAHRLEVKAVLGVGGLFDFYSGHVPRAPIWLRELSLEWIWRLIVQPREKAKRYLIGTPVFLLRIVRSICKTDKFANQIEVCQ